MSKYSIVITMYVHNIPSHILVNFIYSTRGFVKLRAFNLFLKQYNVKILTINLFTEIK